MNHIRNVCILAHVDHGKTSLADVLISPSGVISQRSAADLRFMDSTEDEQQRGITMKSSAISLTHNYCNKLKDKEENKKYFINLIDSPGHVDFSGEVLTAVKISDNAFIVVDVVEGVCPQTRTVLQQAWKEDLNFILVLNKVDKLHSELKLNTIDAYAKLMEIIEDVHHLIGELISQDVKAEEEKNDSFLSKECISERFDTMPFHPLKGRVVFCSAFHHWGFRISDFVEAYSNLLGIEKQDLYKKMWGDFYLTSKKTIVKGALASNRKNLFTSLILDQIWAVYNALESNEIDRVVSMMSKLNIEVTPRKNVNESSSQILNTRHVLNSWMPICTVLLDTLIEKCPDPKSAMTEKKLRVLVPNDRFARARDILRQADTSPQAPAVVFISKVMLQQQHGHQDFQSKELIAFGRVYSGSVKPGMKVFLISPRFNPYKVSDKFLQSTADDFDEGPINVYRDEKDGNEENTDGNEDIGRKFSDVYVVKVNKIFLFVGQDTLVLEHGTSAGHIIGLTGLDWHTVHKNATAVGNCPLGDCIGMFSQFDSLGNEGDNIICVSIEPKKIAFLNELQEALQLLEKADPIVDVKTAPTGEMLLYAAGEIHLQKCLNDLQTRIVPHIELDISPPIVPFRETIIHSALCDTVLFAALESLSLELKELKSNVVTSTETDAVGNSLSSAQQGLKESTSTFIRLPQRFGSKLCVRISVHSLPKCLIEWIERNSASFSRLTKAQKHSQDALSKHDTDILANSLKTALQEADKEEIEICSGSTVTPIDYEALFEQFWTIGDSQATLCNMLFSYVGRWGVLSAATTDHYGNDAHGPLYHAIVKGFQRALKEGPICEEPIKNVVFIVHDVWEATEETVGSAEKTEEAAAVAEEEDGHGDGTSYRYNRAMDAFLCNGGQLSNATTRGCRTALMCHPGARLLMANYKLEIEIRINMFKNLASIIRQLHGDVVRQEVSFGNFLVEASLPVIESFGFGDRLRKRTSGEVALPQLRTIVWTVLECSPLLDPRIHAALSDRSEGCDIGITQELVARTQGYLCAVRQRKGLDTRRQIVECGDKQRTLSRKK